MQSSRRGLVRLLGHLNSASAVNNASKTAGSGSRGFGMNLGSGFSRRYLSRSEGLDVPRDPHKQVCRGSGSHMVCK
jgi:hypothetical protein